jgi:bifunctional non-homologous end joining protein LigD
VDLISVGAARATASQQRTILAHYERVAPLIVANFPNVPLVFTYYPDGLGKKPTFSNNHETLPNTIPHVPVTTSSGSHIYPGCAVNTILYYIHTGAVGVHSWTPAASDPEAVGLARILLKPIAGATQSQLRDALLILRSSLRARELDAIPLFEGRDAALYIPFADAPAYEPVRAWLKDVRACAIAEHPQLLVPNAKPHEQRAAPGIEVTVATKSPGMHSRLPYSLTGDPDLPMATPFDWAEIDTLRNGEITAANAPDRLAKGDIFAALAENLTRQRFAALSS